MISVRLCNGLGNQLFQYAAARSLAERHRVPLAIEFAKGTSPHEVYRLGSFSVRGHRYPRWAGEVYRKIASPELVESWEFGFDKRFLEAGPSTYMIGNFQSLDYFRESLPGLRRELALKPDVRRSMQRLHGRLLESLTRGEVGVVHVRLGDYVASGYDLCKEAYYCQAIQELRDRSDVERVLVISDDCVSAAALFEDVSGVEYAGDLPDLVAWEALRRARVKVIANSSFSYWAAVLSDHCDLVIYPENWYARYDGTATDCGLPMPGWLGVGE